VQAGMGWERIGMGGGVSTNHTVSVRLFLHTCSRAGKQRAGDARGFTGEDNKRGKTKVTSVQIRTDMKLAQECGDLLLSF